VEDHDDVLLTIFWFESSLKYKIVLHSAKSSQIVWISLSCILGCQIINGCFDDTFLIHEIPSQPTKTDKKKPRTPYAMPLGHHLCADMAASIQLAKCTKPNKLRKET
jgi:hypothetical protein